MVVLQLFAVQSTGWTDGQSGEDMFLKNLWYKGPTHTDRGQNER